MTSTTIELPDDLHTRVQELAQATDRPITDVLIEAVMQYLEWDRWFRDEVAKGRQSAEMGPLIPADEVWADFLHRGLVTRDALAAADAEAEDDAVRDSA